jgi:hypothetical protein
MQMTPREQNINTPELAVLRSGGEPGVGHLLVLRDFGREEYEKYADARRLVTTFVDSYMKFTMTRRSYAEYIGLLRAYDEEYSSERPLSEIQARAIKQEVNRRLRGFLTELRSFVDHAIAELEKEYGGNEADEVQSFMNERSQIFNSSPSYRLVNKLRDYALHRDVVIQNMTYRIQLNRETGEPQSFLSFHVIRDELLQASFNWTKHVPPYLETLPERFKIDPHIEIARYDLEKMHVAFVAAKLPKVKEAASYINNLASSVEEPGDPCIVFNAPGRDPAGSDVEHLAATIDHIPTDMATGIESLPEPDELRKLPGLEINFVDAEGTPIGLSNSELIP